MNRSSLRARRPRPGARCHVWRSAAAAALLGVLLAAGAASAQSCAPEVLVQPADQTVCPGHTATFTAVGVGTLPFSIQWQISTDGGQSFHEVNPEDTSSTLSFTASPAQSGYQFKAFFGNICGFQFSRAATLTVVTPFVSATPSVLWPPNNKMVLVTVAANNSCGSLASNILRVTNNETGVADAQIISPNGVWLRATRLGNGHGRVYTITVSVTDPTEYTTYRTVTVTVPHDQGH